MMYTENEAYIDEEGRLIVPEHENKYGNTTYTDENEAYIDEEGRLIVPERENKYGNNTYTDENEAYIDEEGRLIVPERENKYGNTTYTDENEAYIDEEGRLIVPKDENKYGDNTCIYEDEKIVSEDIQDTYHNENNNLADATIKFALVSPECRFVYSTNEWEVNEGEQGLFFIYNVNKDILNKNILLKNSEGDIIWECEIRELPNNTLVLANCNTEKIYISKKVLRSNDINNSDDVLFATIEGYESDNAMAILNICDMRNNKVDEDSTVNIYIGNIFEVEESEPIKYTEEDDDYVESNGNLYGPLDFDMQDYDDLLKSITKKSDYKEDLDANNDEQYKYDVVEVEKDSVEKLVYNNDIKSVVIQSVLNYAPINIDCRRYEVEKTLEASIIVEKVSNYYVAILNGFMNRPIYLLNGENQYFEFDGTPKEFLVKIQAIICRMYSMDKDEFNSLKKIFILDEKDNEGVEEIDNINVLSRNELLDLIVKTKDKVIVDLLNEKCNILFNDEDDNTVKIVCEGLGLKNGINVLESIKNLCENVGLDRVVLTGLFIDNELHSKVKVEEDNIYTVNMLSKYVTI